MKKALEFSVGLTTAMIMVLIAPAAHAYTPTLSEVRVLSGPASDDSVDGLALTSDAKTAVVTSNDAAWVVDVSSNVATEISGLPGASVVVLDSDENYAYVVSGQLSISKVNIATASVVDTWSDVSVVLYAEQLFLSPDGGSLYAVGLTGSFPNYSTGVVEVNLSSGAMTKHVAMGDGPPQHQAAYHSSSGKIFIPRGSSGSTNFVVFDTASNTFTEIPWVGAGNLGHCDSQNGVMACVVDGPVPYVATVSDGGAVVSSLDLTVDGGSLNAITLTPNGTQAYILVSNSNFLGSIEAVDLTNMTSFATLATSLEFPERVAIAPSASQIWFSAYYAEDFNGGYQVLQYADPNAGSGGSEEDLANTGASSAIAGVLVAVSALAIVAGVVSRRAARRLGA